MKPILPRVHILTDINIQSIYTHYTLARMAFEAGRCAVQYRQKHFDPTIHLAELQAIAQMAKEKQAVLIINDYLELALQVEASGVHLGVEDTPLQTALNRLDKHQLIGATVHSFEEYDAISSLEIDYVGVGPVFGTTSKKTDLRPLGVDALREFCQLSKFPVIAIGNISPQNAEKVFHAGAYGVAILSAFVCAEHPTKIARQLLDIIK